MYMEDDETGVVREQLNYYEGINIHSPQQLAEQLGVTLPVISAIVVSQGESSQVDALCGHRPQRRGDGVPSAHAPSASVLAASVQARTDSQQCRAPSVAALVGRALTAG